MGLFGSSKKKEELGFPSLSKERLPPVNDLHPNIPDDIPLQMPPVQTQNSLNSSRNPSHPPDIPSYPQKDFSRTIPSFGSMTDISSQMLHDPENPFEREHQLKQVEDLAYGKESAFLSSPKDPFPRQQVPELDHMHDWSSSERSQSNYDTPLFVNVLDFAQILEHVVEIKNASLEMNTSISRVNGLQKDKDAQFATYSKTLELMQKKLIAVDKALFEE